MSQHSQTIKKSKFSLIYIFFTFIFKKKVYYLWLKTPFFLGVLFYLERCYRHWVNSFFIIFIKILTRSVIFSSKKYLKLSSCVGQYKKAFWNCAVITKLLVWSSIFFFFSFFRWKRVLFTAQTLQFPDFFYMLYTFF